MIIFIAAGVIILTIVTAISILPIILDKIEEKSTTDMEIKIAQETIEILQKEKDQENIDEVNDIVRIYYSRIRKLKMGKNNLSINKQIRLEREILKNSIRIEQDQLDELLQNEEIDDKIYVTYARLLKAFSRKNNKKSLPG